MHRLVTPRNLVAVVGLGLLLSATALVAQEGGRPFEVKLTGAAERPNAGDPDGAGHASLRVNPGQNQVCYEITASNIEPATMSHIHRGNKDVAGPIVVDFKAPTTGTVDGCATPRAGFDLDELMETPENFYVNVHNAPFKGGAIRGQLAAGKQDGFPGPKSMKNPFFKD